MKKHFQNTIIITTLLVLLFSFFSVSPALAQTELGYKHYVGGWEVIPEECIDPQTSTTIDGKQVIQRCDLNSFVQLFINLANIMLKLSPPLAIIIIIYGGYRFIGARGKQESIEAGKKILSSTFIGLSIIIFLGWTLTFFVVQALTGTETDKLFNSTLNVTSTDWWNPDATTSDDDTVVDLQCCVVQNSGCAMTTASECTALGGQRDPLFTESCVGNTTCANMATQVNCCKSPDANANGQPDRCITVASTDLAGCVQYPDYVVIGSTLTCQADPIVCDLKIQ